MLFCLRTVKMLPGFLLVFSAVSGRILYVSDNVSDELDHPVVSETKIVFKIKIPRSGHAHI